MPARRVERWRWHRRAGTSGPATAISGQRLRLPGLQALDGHRWHLAGLNVLSTCFSLEGRARQSEEFSPEIEVQVKSVSSEILFDQTSQSTRVRLSALCDWPPCCVTVPIAPSRPAATAWHRLLSLASGPDRTSRRAEMSLPTTLTLEKFLQLITRDLRDPSHRYLDSCTFKG